MIFGFVHKIKLPEFFQKPLYSCVLCMASIWGTTGFIIINGIDINLWREWLITIVMLIPMNGALWGLYKRIE